MDFETPVIARPKGFHVEVKAGRRYFWCACGRSASQPFCDGSHAGTAFTPVLFEATADEDVIFCGCKHTGTRPFCDGTHNNLPGGYAEDDPESPANRAIPTAARRDAPDVRLGSGCYVFSTSRAPLMTRGNMRYCAPIGPARGAEFQSQFYAEIFGGASPIMAANGAETVLFVVDGAGEIEISGLRFDVEPRAGNSVRPHEAFRIHPGAGKGMRLFISQGPASHDLGFVDEMPDSFDDTRPERIARIDHNLRRAMGERYFQLLVNREHGCTGLTQFTGHIPRSKAEPHRHLYEEALIFLSGEGMVWTEAAKTPVSAGDVLFLPRKCAHSVQSTTNAGLDVVGVICPGDNPSISY